MVKKKTNTPKKQVVQLPGTYDALRNAALVVSLTINVAIFIGWLILKLTTQYDEQVYEFLFNR